MRTPKVDHVDLIMGEVTGKVEDRSTATNPTTKVVKRSPKKIGNMMVITSRLLIL